MKPNSASVNDTVRSDISLITINVTKYLFHKQSIAIKIVL